MPKFRCKFNGVIINFKENEVEEMMKHEGYEIVVDEITVPREKPKKKKGKAK